MKTLPETCSWFPFSDEPLITSTAYAPRFSDPQVILPQNSCDGKWHMFFHSWIGIHHFTSDSGIGWDPQHVIEFRGHSPYIFCEGDYYYLVYEKNDREIPLLKNRHSASGNEANCRIEMIVSTDLTTWSKPRLLLEASNVPYASDYLKSARISRPQLLRFGSQYRLYFGASSIALPDSSMKADRYFGYAVSQDIQGPYYIDHNAVKPVLQPEPDDKWTNLGIGSIRLVPYDGKLYAFRCGVFWDQETKKTRSALMILKSDDGISFERVSDKPVLVPAERGWADGYITACDCHYMEDERCWYCYFSALGNAGNMLKNESIGLMLGSPAVKVRTSEQQVLGIF